MTHKWIICPVCKQEFRTVTAEVCLQCKKFYGRKKQPKKSEGEISKDI